MAELHSLQDVPITVTVPLIAVHLSMVDHACGHMARVAGLELFGASRAKIICEEIYNYAVKKAGQVGSENRAEISFTAVAEGLEISFASQFLLFSPSDILPEYDSVDLLNDDEDDLLLSMHLVKSCAQKITLTQNGTERILSFMVSRREIESGRQPWARIIPSLSEGAVLTPIKKDGKRLHRLDLGSENKSYLIRQTAHLVLEMVDGKQSFSAIMAKIMQLMPDTSSVELEDMFESLVASKILETKTNPRSEVEIDVPSSESSLATTVIKAYTENRRR